MRPLAVLAVFAFGLVACEQSGSDLPAQPRVHIASGVPIIPLPQGLRYAPHRVPDSTIPLTPNQEEFERGAAFVENLIETTSPKVAALALPNVTITKRIGHEDSQFAAQWDLASGLLALNANLIGSDRERELIETTVYTMAIGFAYEAGGVGVDYERWAEVAGEDVPWLTGDYPPSRSTRVSEAALERGFRSENAMGSPAQDLAEICYSLLIGEAELWAAYRRHEILREKIELAMEFMQDYDPNLTRESFLDRRDQPLIDGPSAPGSYLPS